MATRELRTAVVIDAKDRTGRAFRDTRRGVESVSRSLDKLQRRAITLAGIHFIAPGALRRIDDYQQGLNRLRTVTDGSVGALRARLAELAGEARSSIGATIESFQRLALSAQESGRSQEEMLRVQEILNKATAIGGSNAVEASAGLRQFAQGLASNRLQGDELRSVLEGLPGVTDALITGLNRTGAVGRVTRGSLRELAAHRGGAHRRPARRQRGRGHAVARRPCASGPADATARRRRPGRGRAGGCAWGTWPRARTRYAGGGARWGGADGAGRSRRRGVSRAWRGARRSSGIGSHRAARRKRRRPSPTCFVADRGRAHTECCPPGRAVVTCPPRARGNGSIAPWPCIPGALATGRASKRR